MYFCSALIQQDVYNHRIVAAIIVIALYIDTFTQSYLCANPLKWRVTFHMQVVTPEKDIVIPS